ncbi:hypothetical protein MAR_034727 [Mya arenaria]|uniref:Uncharacterized protein n=1 Tax=Mya arenaria TaxID=6604 RepID=A0ABY7ELN4_MYAAR|nr:hypothetical protein MAR_034727 [Mya arenaria]
MIPSSSPSPITQYDLRINEANFDGDNVKLEVWIDRSKAGVEDTLAGKTAEEFVFKHGHYEVLKLSQHVGIYGQWFATWKPRRTVLKSPSPRKLFSLLIPRLGTWFFSQSRDNWIHFLEWFAQVNQDKTFQPYVAGNVVTMWFKTFQAQGRADGEQSIYHIYHSWKFKEYTLYPNFKDYHRISPSLLQVAT